MAVYRVQRVYSNIYQKEFGAFGKFLNKAKSGLKKLRPGAKAREAQRLAEEKAAEALKAQKLAEEKAASAIKSRNRWRNASIAGLGVGGVGLGVGIKNSNSNKEED